MRANYDKLHIFLIHRFRGSITIKKQNRLTLGEKMAAIRKAIRKTQVYMAATMGYSGTLIAGYENNRNPVSSNVLNAFRGVAGVEGIPLTDDEVFAATKEMIDWNDSITLGDINQVNELHKKFERYVRWAFDLDLENLFDIFRIKYLCKIGKKEEAEKLADSLEERVDDFTNMHLYWYYRYLGFLKHLDWLYKPALIMYIKAETIGKQLHLNDIVHYYNIGSCLINCDYLYLAIDYLEKVVVTEINLANIRYSLSIQKMLAICYGKLGKIDKALKLLKDCLKYLLSDKKDDKLNMCGVYLYTGRVYQDAGNYEKALENFDMSTRFCNEKDEVFLTYLCYKATLLRDCNRNDEVRKCLDKGLPLVTKSTLWYDWLHAIKHSLLLDEKPSLDYIIHTSVKNLNNYGKHTMVINCYKWLSIYFERERKYKKALFYNKKASDIYKRLMEGDMSL